MNVVKIMDRTLKDQITKIKTLKTHIFFVQMIKMCTFGFICRILSIKIRVSWPFKGIFEKLQKEEN